MVELLLINPNTTASITDLVLEVASGFAAPDTRLRAVTGAFGPRYIASRAAYAVAGHAALDAFANDKGRKDAVVLACFGDPGLAALKEGKAEAASALPPPELRATLGYQDYEAHAKQFIVG